MAAAGAAAMGGANLINAGASAASGLLGLGGSSHSRERRKARTAIRTGTNAGVNALNPYSNLGLNALGDFNAASRAPIEGFEFNLETDPGYRFIRDEALQATRRGNNAGGYQDSGNILAALQDRAGGVASRYTNEAFGRQLASSDTNFNRDQAGLNRLRDLVGIGGQAANSISNLRANEGANIANVWQGAANAGQQQNQFALNSANNAIQGYAGNNMLLNLLNNNSTGGYRPPY